MDARVPRVLLIIVGSPDLDSALEICRPRDPERGPVRVLLVDPSAAASDAALEGLIAAYEEPSVALLCSHTQAPRGAWNAVFRRPISIGEIADGVTAMLDGRAPPKTDFGGQPAVDGDRDRPSHSAFA